MKYEIDTPDGTFRTVDFWLAMRLAGIYGMRIPREIRS